MSVFYSNHVDLACIINVICIVLWDVYCIVGHGGAAGALVEVMTFNRRVVGSTPTLAAT